jgi:hypothetical protein
MPHDVPEASSVPAPTTTSDATNITRAIYYCKQHAKEMVYVRDEIITYFQIKN